MKFQETNIKGCFVIVPEIIQDDRGWFARTFCEKEFLPYLGEVKFVQINHSYNRLKGTFRGVHYQTQPYADGKLIRCIGGRVMDFIVDLRPDSSTFMSYLQVELSRKNRTMVFLPEGMGHGFQTLEDDSELIYHHTEFYQPSSDSGIRYDDPRLNIKLPLAVSMISEKDKSYDLLTHDFKGIQL